MRTKRTDEFKETYYPAHMLWLARQDVKEIVIDEKLTDKEKIIKLQAEMGIE